jgi:hypothetical protein
VEISCHADRWKPASANIARVSATTLAVNFGLRICVDANIGSPFSS